MGGHIMIPILYEKNETEFKTQGLGCLTDTLTCTVTEERNGQYELEMTYPTDFDMSLKLTLDRIIYAPHDDNCETDWQPFRIYKVTKLLNGTIKVAARHVSYQLSDIVTSASTTESKTAADAMDIIFANALTACPFTHSTDVDTDGTFTVGAPASIRSLLGNASHSVLNTFGGEYEWDKWNVILHKKRGTESGVTLRYGVDITSLTDDETAENYTSAIVAYWHGKDSAGSDTYIVGEPVISGAKDDTMAFDRFEIYDASNDFASAPTQSDLTTVAENQKSTLSTVLSQTLTVSFTPQWVGEKARQKLHLCDLIQISDPRLGLSAEREIVKTVYNVLTGQFDSIDIGDPKPTLESAVSTIAQTIADVQKAVTDIKNNAQSGQGSGSGSGSGVSDSDATKWLGLTGGYIRIDHDTDGKPYQILAMDTADISTAKKIVRLNKDGLMYTSGGQSGTYTYLVSNDGLGRINTAQLHGTLVLDRSHNSTTQTNVAAVDKMEIHYNDSTYGTLSDYGLVLTGTSGDGNSVQTEYGAEVTSEHLYLHTSAVYAMLSNAGFVYQFYKSQYSKPELHLLDGQLELNDQMQLQCEARSEFSNSVQFSEYIPHIKLSDTNTDGMPVLIGADSYYIAAGSVRIGHSDTTATVTYTDEMKEYTDTENAFIFIQQVSGADTPAYITEKTADRFTVTSTGGVTVYYLIIARVTAARI